MLLLMLAAALVAGKVLHIIATPPATGYCTLCTAFVGVSISGASGTKVSRSQLSCCVVYVHTLQTFSCKLWMCLCCMQPNGCSTWAGLLQSSRGSTPLVSLSHMLACPLNPAVWVLLLGITCGCGLLVLGVSTT